MSLNQLEFWGQVRYSAMLPAEINYSFILQSEVVPTASQKDVKFKIITQNAYYKWNKNDKS